jgi:hypothetical protein
MAIQDTLVDVEDLETRASRTTFAFFNLASCIVTLSIKKSGQDVKASSCKIAKTPIGMALQPAQRRITNPAYGSVDNFSSGLR